MTGPPAEESHDISRAEDVRTDKTCAKPKCSNAARVSNTIRGPPFVGDLCESCYQERQEKREPDREQQKDGK